jgi:hypothetical protein
MAIAAALLGCKSAPEVTREPASANPVSSSPATPLPSGSRLAEAPTRPPLTLPPKIQGIPEPDDDPRVENDTAAICAQLSSKHRYSAFNQMATFTRRWGQLSWLYANGDRDAACQIAELVKRAAAHPESPCKESHVRRFEDSCRYMP